MVELTRPDISPVLPKSLRRIYREVPDVHCKGLCQDACTAPPAQGIELRQIFRFVGTEEREALPGRRCPYLSVEGRCGVYEVRPLVCRLFGAVEKMVCPHGCAPDKGFMNRRKEHELMMRLLDLDPEVRNLDPVTDGEIMFFGREQP